MKPVPEAGFREVFAETCPDILAFLRRRTDTHHAEDLAAEVFAIAWDKWDEMPREVRPWLFGVARNLFANDQRASARRRRLELCIGNERIPADDQMSLAATSLDLRMAWSRLTDDERETLALVAWDGLTGREAAQVLGCSRAAYSVRLTRARRRLRSFVDDIGPVRISYPAAAPASTSSAPAVPVEGIPS